MHRHHQKKYTDIRQSPVFASFMETIGFRPLTLGTTYVYTRPFPLIGRFSKIPRPSSLTFLDGLEDFQKKYRIFQMKISPFLPIAAQEYDRAKKELKRSKFTVDMQPFNPTTTITIDLTRSEKSIFDHFLSAKRRAVRRAKKNHITVRETDDVNAFIEIRKVQYKPMGFLVVSEMKAIWKHFFPDNAALLLAYTKEGKSVGGILLLFYDGIAYYWFASALLEGKKLFAPTALVHEAVKLAKRRGCRLFDFEGIADSRFPEASKPWLGFTKFKEGFGGNTITFAENVTRNFFPF